MGTVHRTGSVTRQRSRNRGSLVWASVIAGIVVVALGVTASLVLSRTGTSSIPTVSDIKAGVSGTSVTFRWSDPGIEAGDTYVIASNGGASQQSGTTFVVSGARGDEECVTVTVNRDGKNGDPSAQKCVTIGDD